MDNQRAIDMASARALILVLLLLVAPLSGFVTPSSADSVINSDSQWSGEVILSGNVTVANGTTLTIQSGTTIDAKEYWISVEGTLDANGVYFNSSNPSPSQGSHGAGLWVGIEVANNGHAVLQNVVIENAETGVLVEGTLEANNLIVNDSYIAINVIGSSSVSDFTANHIDFDAIRNSGNLVLDDATFDDIAIGVSNSGNFNGQDIAISSSGIGLSGSNGNLIANRVGISQTTVGISSVSGASVEVSNITGSDVLLLVDAANSDDLQLNTAAVAGQRLLSANGATQYRLNDIRFQSSTDANRATIDSNCAGTCQFNQLEVWDSNHLATLSGNGQHEFSASQLTGQDSGISASGQGILSIQSTNITTQQNALFISGPDSSLQTVAIEHLSSTERSVNVLGGNHDWEDVIISKTYSSFDSQSEALNIWYSNINLGNFEVNNFATSINTEQSTITATDIVLEYGKEVGIDLSNTSFKGNSLHSTAQETGVRLTGHSSLHLSQWTAALHTTPLSLSDGSQATVRNFQPQNSAGSSQALGDGYFLYGSSSSQVIATSSSDKFIETPVTFTDLIGNPVEANILVHGFELTSDVNGAADLPLLSSGSMVSVTLDGAGVRVSLIGGQGGQSVQIPVIPSGDWTIPSGQFVVLNPKPDGTAHILSGDLTISNNAGLSLVGVDLQLPSTAEIDVQGSGTLSGQSATISVPNIFAGTTAMVSADIGHSLTLDANLIWSCQTLREVSQMIIKGSLTLQPGCEVEMTGGVVEGSIAVLTGGEFTLLSKLEVTVLDKGEPVVGAIVSVDGAMSQTDDSGQVSTSATARHVDDSSDTTGGMKTVALQIDSFTDMTSWDSSASLTHTFMASTLPIGTINSWLILESQWSPYYLDGNLEVGQFATLTIHDGVAVRSTEGSTITVNGVLDAGIATLSSTGFGARWGGLVLGEYTSSLIDLSGTHVVEASKALTIPSLGVVEANSALFARSSGSDPLMQISSGSSAKVNIRNSQFHDGGSGCIIAYPSTTTLSLADVELDSCNELGIWARQVELQIDGLIIGENTSSGMELAGVTGSAKNIDASLFNGNSNVMRLESIDGQFSVDGLSAVVAGTAAITGNNNREISLSNIEITGAPAIDFDNTAGTISTINLIGQGTGTGLTVHHGKSASSLEIEDISIANYAIAIDLHADTGESPADLIIRNADLWASTAISAEGFGCNIEEGIIVGEIESSSTEIVLVDVDSTSATFSLIQSEAYVYETFILDARLNNQSITADYQVSISGIDDQLLSYSGHGVEAKILLKWISSSTTYEATTITLLASAEEVIDTEAAFELPLENNHLMVNMTVNGQPTASISSPYPGQRFMETTHLTAIAQVSDDYDSIEQLTLLWIVSDVSGNEVLRGPDELQYNLTDITQGIYVLELQVTDTFGKVAIASVDFEVTALDSDGDWTSSCDDSDWFDNTLTRSCGPDIYDEDDDNDGFTDIKDKFPLDACAFADSDDDGMPDDINCPEGTTTWLFEDQDDDNDGTPDILEGVASGDENVISTTGLLLVIGLIIIAIMLVVRSRKGGGNSEMKLFDERLL